MREKERTLKKSERQELNQRPCDLQSHALPLSYARSCKHVFFVQPRAKTRGFLFNQEQKAQLPEKLFWATSRVSIVVRTARFHRADRGSIPRPEVFFDRSGTQGFLHTHRAPLGKNLKAKISSRKKTRAVFANPILVFFCGYVASMAQWQSTDLVSLGSWVRSPVEAFYILLLSTREQLAHGHFVGGVLSTISIRTALLAQR